MHTMSSERIRASTLSESFEGEYDRIADIEWATTGEDGTWLMLVCDWGSNHVVPVLDLLIHRVAADDECACGPSVSRTDDGHGWVVAHASLDGREERE